MTEGWREPGSSFPRPPPHGSSVLEKVSLAPCVAMVASSFGLSEGAQVALHSFSPSPPNPAQPHPLPPALLFSGQQSLLDRRWHFHLRGISAQTTGGTRLGRDGQLVAPGAMVRPRLIPGGSRRRGCFYPAQRLLGGGVSLLDVSLTLQSTQESFSEETQDNCMKKVLLFGLKRKMMRCLE